MDQGDNTQFVEKMDRIEEKVRSLADSTKELTKLDIEYEAVMDEDVVERLQALKIKLNGLSRKLLLHQGLPEYTDSVLVNDSVINLQVLDTIDDSYIRFDRELDSIIKSRTKSKRSQPVRMELTNVGDTDKPVVCFKAEQQERPQLSFTDKVDNGYLSGYVSKVYQKGLKYNAITPLTQDELKLKDTDLTEISLEQAESLPHPYQVEIKNLPLNLDPTPLATEFPEPLESTEFTFVETEQDLDLMLENLKEVDLIAVDLEYHHFRSYFGFVCLMQITANNHDYVIDTLKVRSEMFKLNQVFTNPNILKVFHGSDSDIQWLQQDFSIYVVNMFDTYFATKHLNFPKHSLAYLLDRFCDVKAEKQFQLADWRIRPLPLPMVNYARTDTHYLPYIHAMLRNLLVEESNPETLNLLKSSLEQSNHLTLSKFLKPKFDMELGPNKGWSKFLEKHRLSLNARQFMVLKLLFGWRDRTAREVDESTNYILPNYHLFDLAMKLPTTTNDVIKNITTPSPALRMNLTEVVELIISTKDVPITATLVNLESNREIAPNNLPDTIQLRTKIPKVDSRYLSHIHVPYPVKEPYIPLSSNEVEQLILKCSTGLPSTDQLNIQPSVLVKLSQIHANLDLNFLPANVTIHEKAEEDLKIPDTVQPETHKFQLPAKTEPTPPQIHVLSRNSNFKKTIKNEDDLIQVSTQQHITASAPTSVVDLTNTQDDDDDIQLVSEVQSLLNLSGAGKNYNDDAHLLNQQLQLSTNNSKKGRQGRKRENKDREDAFNSISATAQKIDGQKDRMNRKPRKENQKNISNNKGNKKGDHYRPDSNRGNRSMSYN